LRLGVSVLRDDSRMAEVEPKLNQVRYRRLRGVRRTLTLSRAALLTADDHLLLCDYRSGFTERYKRFYFRDIEAIIVRKTNGWLIGLMVWAVLGLIFFMIGTAWSWNKWTTITIDGICALFLLRGLLRGPSCRAHIQTAVQTDVLPMFKRVRKTKRVLTRTLFPLIEHAQGKMETGAPPTSQPPIKPSSASESSPSPAAAGSTTAPVPVVEQSLATEHKLSWLHFATFGVVFLTGLNAIWEVNYPSTLSYGVCVTLFALSVVGGIASLVWQGKHRVHRGAATMTWFLVVTFVIGGGIIDYVYTVTNFASQINARAQAGTPRPAMMNFVTPFQMRPMPGFEKVLWSYGIWSVVLGLTGLIFVFMPAPAKMQPPPLPAKDRA
jgi:hypothetical protein